MFKVMYDTGKVRSEKYGPWKLLFILLLSFLTISCQEKTSVEVFVVKP
jgi:hypothetical protein